MRILAASALLGLTASCAWPPPEAAMPPAALPVAATAPVPLLAPSSVPLPAAVATEPRARLAVATGPTPPGREIESVPMPFIWQRMLTRPPPAGRLMLNNFSFEATRVQAVLASGAPCAIGDGATVMEFPLPPNGTRVLPAPPGMDICWRRQLTPGEAKDVPPTGPWTAWSRAYTGPGRFLDVVVVTPEPVPAVFATVNTAPALPPTMEPAFPMPAER